MSSIFLIIGHRICVLDAFGAWLVFLIAQAPRNLLSAYWSILLEACKDTSKRKQLCYLVLEGNWITLVVIINLDL
jgi:hypothetical protein